MIDTAMVHAATFSRNANILAFPEDELAAFEMCPMCSQVVDRRDIFAVMHHLELGHHATPVH